MAKKEKKEEKQSIAETIKAIRSKYKDDSIIMKLDQRPLVGIDCISTGSFGLDISLGIGGLPQGRIVEIYGQESTGKTTLALHTVAEAQKKGGVCAYIDAEHALDPEYARKIGVKTEDLFITQPSYGEQALDLLESLIASNGFAVIIVDSVASLIPKSELEGEMGDQSVGRAGKMMSQAMRKLVALIAHSKTLVIFINQLRENIGVIGWGPKYYTPGGKALKFFSSVRLEISRIAQIKQGEEVKGSRVKVKVVKNKCAPPFKQTEFDLMYGEGISFEGELLALGDKYHVISKSTGSSYSFGEIKLGRGYDASKRFLKENPEIAKEIKENIITKLAVPVEISEEEIKEEKENE